MSSYRFRGQPVSKRLGLHLDSVAKRIALPVEVVEIPDRGSPVLGFHRAEGGVAKIFIASHANPKLAELTTAHEAFHLVLNVEGWIRAGTREGVPEFPLVQRAGNMIATALTHKEINRRMRVLGFDESYTHRTYQEQVRFQFEHQKGDRRLRPLDTAVEALTQLNEQLSHGPRLATELRTLRGRYLSEAAALGDDLLRVASQFDLATPEGSVDCGVAIRNRLNLVGCVIMTDLRPREYL